MEELLDYIHQWLKENLKSYVYTELYTNEPIIDIDKAMLGLRHDLKTTPIRMLNVKKFYLRLRKHGKKRQEHLRKQLHFKATNNPLYSEYQHGLAEGYSKAYINITMWFNQCKD